jgi:hypothetical protein
VQPIDREGFFAMTLRTFIGNRDSLSDFELVAWLKRRLAQSPRPSRRYNAYALMLETVEHLAHTQGVVEFPAPKIERLLARAKVLTGWVRESPIARVPQSTNVPEHHKWCATCERIKHLDLFKRQATAAECRAYGWRTPHTKVRWVYDNHCKACHENGVRRKRAAVRRRLAKSSTYTRLKQLLERKIKDTKRKADETHTSFYLLRLACLKQALLEVERRVDDGLEVSEECLSDWTLLLPEQERECLFAAYQAVLEGRTAGRTPSL